MLLFGCVFPIRFTKREQNCTAAWQRARWILLEQVVDKSPVVTVETLNQRGEISWRNLDLSDFQADDLDGDFLKKIGLNSYQPAIRPIIAQVTPEGAGSRAGAGSAPAGER